MGAGGWGLVVYMFGERPVLEEMVDFSHAMITKSLNADCSISNFLFFNPEDFEDFFFKSRRF